MIVIIHISMRMTDVLLFVKQVDSDWSS